MHTVRHFVTEKVPRHTIYAILEGSEHFPTQRANESGKLATKCPKSKLASI